MNFGGIDFYYYLCTRKTEKGFLRFHFGALVQLVRMPACHAGGHEFESRTHRLNPFCNAWCVSSVG